MPKGNKYEGHHVMFDSTKAGGVSLTTIGQAMVRAVKTREDRNFILVFKGKRWSG